MSARPKVLAQYLHLLALSALAVAQPLLDILRQNPTFFTARRTSALGIVAFALLAVVLPAAGVCVVRLVFGLFSSDVGWAAQSVLVGLLASAVVVPPVMRALSLGIVLTGVVFVAVAAGALIAYRRLAVVRRFLTVLGVAPVLIVGLFVLTDPISRLVFSGNDEAASVKVKTDTPVVLAIFDEFSLATLVTPDGRLDAERFPNIATLAKRSTWFRNGTTNSTSTQVSVPIINTGVTRSRKGSSLPPDASSYPDNLFTLLHPSMRMHAQEFTTHLCPSEVCPGSGVAASGPRYLLSDAAVVYLHLVLPSDITKADAFPQVNEDWSGFLGDARSIDQTIAGSPGVLRPMLRAVLPRFATPSAASEAAQMLRFVRQIKDYPKQTFHYAHVKMPHIPLEFTPSLRRYAQKNVPGLQLLPAEEECDECEGGARTARFWTKDQVLADQGLQRYLLQAKAVDELIGRLMRTLQQQDLWDDAMVVVTSDHGVTSQPGELRRRVSDRTLADVMRVPLFVKAPGQKSGRIDDRNAQLVDVVPTIADALGIEPTWKVDGHSLLERDARVKDKVLGIGPRAESFELEDGDFGVTPGHIRDVFGPARARDDLYAMGPFAGLVSFKVVGGRDSDLSAMLTDRRAFDRVNPDGQLLPARLVARLSAEPPTRWIAAALNGRIAGIGVSYRDGGGAWRASVMLSERLFREGKNRVELFALTKDGDLERIAT